MNNNKIIFISDIHLGLEDDSADREREQVLVKFLRNELNKGDRLFIVGDLFDFWFEYKTVIPKGHLLILGCIRELVDSGVKIDYVAGNHDFWVGDFFTKELGLDFHAEPVTEEINGKKFFVIHGDGLLKKDSGYRLLKKVFRNRLNIFLYRWLHPDLGVPFAKWCSGTSRDHTSKKDFGGVREYIDFAENKFRNGIDYVIMGHMHQPLKHSGNNGKMLINTGDWINHYTYAKFENGVLTLEEYKK